MTQTAPAHESVETVNHVDLARYLGDWFEICRLPMKWEDEGASDITASYSLNDDGSIKVDNRCLNEKGEPTQSIGEATAVDATNAKLKVTFLPKLLRWIPFTEGDYWIFKLDPDYRIALVGSPDRKFLWLLARDHTLNEAQTAPYLDWAKAKGFDTTLLIWPRQSGGRVTDEMLSKSE